MSVTRRQVMGGMLAMGLSGLAFSQGGTQPIKAVTDATFPPMEFVENGQRTGFDIELVEAIGKVLGRPIEWTDVDFKGLIPSLVSKRADIAVSAIYITPERAEVIDFTKPYLAGGLVAMVRADNTTIKTPADLAGKRISVQVGTKSVQWLREHIPSAELIEVEKNQQMFNLVDIGRSDAAVTGKPAAFQYARTRGGVRILEQQLTTEEYGIAVRKDLPDLTKAFDAAIEQLKANGEYNALVQKWFPTTII
ncbi:Glutamine-binding periplasmic protein [Saezia sanguinis]|uniref:Glutamine-binding periplasmic protein n=1 Tax=Saezia sanguinis TaxID=1965230 RepID=A0A433SG61_9BURK|nr:Glutamine-binding periplasmic protein [Saezia sanguinis]